MSAPRPSWLSILHALSLGVRVVKDGQNWKFVGSKSEIDNETIRCLIEKEFVEELTGGDIVSLTITPTGKRALFSELNWIIDRTVARWPNPPKANDE